MNIAPKLIHGRRVNASSAQQTTKKRNSHSLSHLITGVVSILLVPALALAEVGARAEALVRTTVKNADRFMPVYTFTEVLGQNHAAVIARKADSSISDETTQKDAKYASFEISDVLKGEQSLVGSTVDARTLRGIPEDKLLLLLGKRKLSKKIRWRVARSVTLTYREHALTVLKLEQSGVQRLTFFRKLLEHANQSV